MCWLSSSKVRLALIVNGLYFIYLLTPATPHTRSRLFAHLGEYRDARVSTKTPPSYAPLAPPMSAPPKADVHYSKENNQLDVFLTNDLTLVRKPEHTLFLSPTFTTSTSEPGHPRYVLLRFISFSDKQVFSEKTPLMISADGVYRWDDSWNVAYGQPRANTDHHSVMMDGSGHKLVETIGVELPYETFLNIISARQVVIELGPDTAELNADQIEALRDMHRRLPQQMDYMLPPADKTGRPATLAVDPKIYSRPLNPKPPVKRQ